MDQKFARMDRIKNNEPSHIDYNHQGMRGKLTIPSFLGHYDAEGYLNWEIMVEQKFSAHLVPEQYRVRQATSEFKDFAIIWWYGLVAEDVLPGTWEELKIAMHDRFIPPSYKHEWHNKLQCLEQGNMSVQEYYTEFQKCAIRCGIVEDMEDTIVRFFGGLRHEIQDIVFHIEFYTLKRLFQLAMLAEKELQECQQKNHTNIGDNLN